MYCRRALDILRKEGVTVLSNRVWSGIKRIFGFTYPGNFDLGYDRWYEKHCQPQSQTQANKVISEFKRKPVFSVIVPVYNVEHQWLASAIDSVRTQLYPHWQLCLVDDASTDPHIRTLLEKYVETDSRICARFNHTNQGIAATSNAALALAEGDFIALLDHDDELTEDALLQSAMAVEEYPAVDLIYSDEDKVSTTGKRSAPFFKPDFSEELLLSQNYIGHLVVVRRSLIEETGGFQSGYEGAQDYDLLLRICENTRHIKHIPSVLYHWREIPGSTAATYASKSHAWEAGKKALQAHVLRTGINATVSCGKHPGTYQVTHALDTTPLVSIVIPFRDKPELLEKCLTSIFEHTLWPGLEVLAIDNNSEMDTTRALIEKWSELDHRVRFMDYPHPFNFSGICNFGVQHASGQYIVLLNNDVELISSRWVESLLAYAQQPGVGAVGAKLLFPDQRIQHAGIVIGIDGGAGHPFKYFPSGDKGYFMRLDLAHNVSAVTAALLMVERNKYLQVGGFDETELAVAYNDVDFCLKLVSAGYRNVYTPHCTAIHRESSSRGYDVGTGEQARHDLEKQVLHSRWEQYFETGDPFYNINLTRIREDYTLNHEL
jgi:glycosyltransferase involved in cell wall biosynthesis